MQLPGGVLATRDRYVAAFPLWVMAPGEAAEDRARTWTLGLIAQVAFEHPTALYGSKRAAKGNPLSKDSMAQPQGNGRLYAWDLLSGAGTGAPTIVAHPESVDITGQIFEPVTGADVIGGAPSTTPPTTPPATSAPPYHEEYAVQFGLGCNDVYRQSGAAMDPGMIAVHATRAAWDYYVGGLTWEASYHKHLNAFRKEYGLPPVT